MLTIPRYSPDADQPKINAIFHELKISFPHMPEALLWTVATAGAVLTEKQLEEILHASDV